MNELLKFLAFLVGVSCLVWAAAAAWRSVSRHYAPRAEIRRLTAREIELAAAVAFQRERNHALVTARDFADSDRSGYVDRTGLEA